jgi:NNP family nitrate/nitrite transporter-like MFS transporter
MNLRDFTKAGHWPTLLCAFVYFDISFMVWVLLGGLSTAINEELHLTDSEKGILVAVPLLGGAALRLVLGVMTDHLGARRTALYGLTATLVPLLLGWLWADSFGHLLAVGALLGVAGASFAAALPMASRWYPPQYQGLALGIAGAGNSGTALALFFAPRLAKIMSWQEVLGLSLIPVLLTLALVALVARESPQRPPPKAFRDYGSVLGKRDTWWFCLFYSVTFGGFVGLASFLSIFFYDQFSLDKVTAGTIATLCVFAGSFLRPVGGYFADQLGGMRLLLALYVGVGLCLLGLATTPPLALSATLMILTMGLLGAGNGAVFQVVPQRFPREIGVLTGIVGAAGGVGGFVLPSLLGSIKEMTGGFGLGFLVFATAALSCAVAVGFVTRVWVGAVEQPATGV